MTPTSRNSRLVRPKLEGDVITRKCAIESLLQYHDKGAPEQRLIVSDRYKGLRMSRDTIVTRARFVTRWRALPCKQDDTRPPG
jgi:hypothetical protein